MARPSTYNEAVADAICEELIDGKSLRKICEAEGMPSVGTVCRWLISHASFREQYAHAREAQMEMMAGDILEIADDNSQDVIEDEDGNERLNGEFVQRAKLRVDTRKWLMSKLAPKKYGDKIGVEHSGEMTVLSERIAAARQRQ